MWYRSGLVIAAVLALAAVFAAGAYLLIGPERLWARSGPADLGDTDFATLARRATPNDALACGEGLCAATADLAAPVFALPAAEMFYAIQQALAPEPRLTLMAKEPERGVLRYVQRSAFLKFPDTVSVKVLALPGGRSAVLLYSRSQIGRGDMGVNRARLDRWIGLIAAKVQSLRHGG